jgi:hypothetical protein
MIEPTRGTCFGYAIHADRPLRFLRHGAGEPLRVTQAGVRPDDPGSLVRRWEPPVAPFRASLYRDGPLWRLWVSDAGWFEIDPANGRIGVPTGRDPVRTEERLWGLPALLCFLGRGDHALHAAAVEVDGGAVLFGAPTRHGKTTLAAALVHAGYRLLTEDLACVRLGAEPAVVPGPAMLRLRLDVAERLRPRHATEVARDADRVRYAIDPARRGSCDPVPVRGVVLLRSGHGRPWVARADQADVVRDLWHLSFHVNSPDDLSRCFAGCAELAARVPVWNLGRRPTFGDLDATIETLLEVARAGTAA